VLVEDEGRGFAPESVPDVDDPASLDLERGRGVLLMQEYMDEVYYFNGGASVLMTKRKG